MRYSIFLLILIFCAFSLPGCQDTAESWGTDETVMEAPDQELWDAEIFFTKNDRISSVLRAEYLAVYEKQGLTIADSSFRLDMFNSRGEHTSVITADSGVVQGEETLMAFGGVVVVTDSGMVLETERLKWDRRLRRIISDTAVTLTSETDTLYGDGLVSDETMENWEITNPRGKTLREL